MTVPVLSQIVNTLALVILTFGISQRRKPRVHMPVMITAFAIDVINVLLVEIYARTQGDGAVEQGIEAFVSGESFLFQLHVTVSLLCIVGYVIAVYTGRKLFRHGMGRRLHRVNARIFICTRLASYVTSFWMMG